MNGLARAFLFLCILFLTIAFGGAYQQAVSGNLFYLLATLGVGAGALAFLFGLLAMLARGKNSDSSISAFLSVMVGLLILGGVGYVYVMYVQKYPFIADVSTDTLNPPQFLGEYSEFEAVEGSEFVKVGSTRLYDLTEDEEAAQKSAYPDIVPQPIPHSPDVAFRSAVKAAAAMTDWTISHSDPAKFHFEAEVATEPFKFIDDIVVEARPDGKGGTLLHVRSRSRAGPFDFGLGAKRIREFFTKLPTALQRTLDADAKKAATAAVDPAAVPAAAVPAAPAAPAQAVPPPAPAAPASPKK